MGEIGGDAGEINRRTSEVRDEVDAAGNRADEISRGRQRDGE